MAARKVKDCKVGDLVIVKPELRPSYEATFADDPAVLKYLTGPLKILAIDRTMSTDFAYEFAYPKGLDGTNFWLFEDEIDVYEGESAVSDSCPCSARDLLHFGHRCGRKAPIDRK